MINRDAIGARATLTIAGVAGVAGADATLVREVRASRGTYNSMDTRTLYFGLGDLGCDYEVSIRWPDGRLETFAAADLCIDKIVTIDYAAGVE